jgi:hypothetical protein
MKDSIHTAYRFNVSEFLRGKKSSPSTTQPKIIYDVRGLTF